MNDSWRSLYWLVVFSAVTALLGIMAFQEPRVQLTLLTIAFFAFSVAIAIIVLLLSRTSKLNLSGVTYSGLFLINGGAVADVCATLFHSPDLTLESNPVVRLLFSIGVGLDGVFVIGFAFQIAICIFISSLFVLMMSWHASLMTSIRETRTVARIVQIFSGPDRTVIDFITGRVVPEYGLAAIAFVLCVSCIYRWYLAAEWFGLVPISRFVAPVLIVIFSFFSYAVYSYGKATTRTVAASSR